MKYRDVICWIIVILLSLSASAAMGASLEDKIRAAESDIKVLCLASSPDQIQWSALLYLNQKFGAEVYIGMILPSPEFGCKIYTSDDKQFHYSPIGRPGGMSDSVFADSIVHCLFGRSYPDIAIIDPASKTDSTRLTAILGAMQLAAKTDPGALTTLGRIFIRGKSGTAAAVILDDEEIFRQYAEKAKDVAASIPLLSEVTYQPTRFRWYYLLNPSAKGAISDFLTGIDGFRLPEIIAERVFDGPERKNLLDRLSRFRSYLRASYIPRQSQADRLKLLLSSYAEITRLVQMLESGTGNLAATRVPYRAKMIRYRTSLAVSEAVGIDWSGRLIMRETPFGKSGKLQLDLKVSGPLPIELSYFKYHPDPYSEIVIDSISTIVQPHQKLYREYQIDLNNLVPKGAPEDSMSFTVEIVIGGLSMDLAVAYSDYGDEGISITWLPGYAILFPFIEGDITSLAQTFDWQLKITKPYHSEFRGRVVIDNPEDIVVGSYNKDIEIPAGVTTKYIDIHLAAGRSIGYNKETVTARLLVGGKEAATTSADVRIVRAKVPETRDIAFVPEPTGQLEDFLRMAKVSFKPLTENGLARASLDAYDLIIIGQDAAESYGVLRSANSRLRQFVKNGGDILIFGQTFGWPYDIFEFPIYTSEIEGAAKMAVTNANHSILKNPFDINTKELLARVKNGYTTWPAIVEDGAEIVSAGEQGSYLKVSKIGDGYVIYCGLPLFDLAGKLDIEAIHLLANLLNFGHGK